MANLLTGNSFTMGVGPALHLPIFDAGKLKAQYARATADLDAEFHRLPEGTHHVLESVHRHGHGALASLMRRGRDALRGLVSQ